jgi:hypothetical protein
MSAEVLGGGLLAHVAWANSEKEAGHPATASEEQLPVAAKDSWARSATAAATRSGVKRVWLNSELAAKVTGVSISVDAGHALLPGFNHSRVRE